MFDAGTSRVHEIGVNAELLILRKAPSQLIERAD